MSLIATHSRPALALVSLLACGCTTGDIGESNGVQPVDEPDAAASPEPCEDGLRNTVDPATGACYMFFDDAVRWQVALAACAALGPDTHLGTVTDQTEVDLLQLVGLDAIDVWLGATDAAEEGTFVWITGEDMEFDNWRGGEPNDGNNPNASEDCMIQEVDNGGTWDDRNCSDRYSYFCERRPGA